MNDKKLNALLEELRTELAKASPIDDEGRELLQSLDTDIHALLESSEDVEETDSLMERLQDAVDYFEATHPSLTSALSHFINALNNAGI